MGWQVCRAEGSKMEGGQASRKATLTPGNRKLLAGGQPGEQGKQAACKWQKTARSMPTGQTETGDLNSNNLAD